jgi:hypothetical protein
MRSIYVAGPYTLGDREANIKEAIDVAEELRGAGYTPIVPHLTFLWSLVHWHPYEYWLDLTMDWMLLCDAVLRLPGESKGADREEEIAVSKGMPIFYSITDLLKTRGDYVISTKESV